MGIIRIYFEGSFGEKFTYSHFPAGEHGHADAVEKAIKHLREVSLPEAINLDVKLGLQRGFPQKGFGETSNQALGVALKQALGVEIKDKRKEHRNE